MRMRFLGKSGLKVSELCLGTMTFGTNIRLGAVGQKEADSIVGIALDGGMNFFDTAGIYSNGQSEEILGKALGKRRKDIILATKVRMRLSAKPNDVVLSWYHIIEESDNSLKRLGIDYIEFHTRRGKEKMKEVVFYARGGQGAVTAAAVLVSAAAKEGKYAQAFPFFGGERRGAPVKAFLRIDSKPVLARGLLHNPDCIIVLDTKLPAIMNVWEGLKPGGIAVFNTSLSPSEVKLNVPLSKIGTVDANQIADSIFGSMAIPFTNFAMLGAFAATTGWIGLSSIIEASYSKFAGKTAKNNEKSTRTAYEATKVMNFDVKGLTDDIHQDEMKARKIKLDLYPGMVINKPSNARTGSWRTRKPMLLAEKCNYCGLCASLCPEGVLVASKDAGWKPDLDQCKGCGICANECPRDAIEMVLER